MLTDNELAYASALLRQQATNLMHETQGRTESEISDEIQLAQNAATKLESMRAKFNFGVVQPDSEI